MCFLGFVLNLMVFKAIILLYVIKRASLTFWTTKSCEFTSQYVYYGSKNMICSLYDTSLEVWKICCKLFTTCQTSLIGLGEILIL